MMMCTVVALLTTPLASVSGCKTTDWACGPRCEGMTAGTQFIRDFYDKWTGAFAYIAVNHQYKRIIVSFRGTTTLANVIQDLNIFLVRVKWAHNDDVKMYSGLINCYNSIRAELSREIGAAVNKYPGYIVTFTGHSLGGGITTIAAQLVTFGAFRAGNTAFAQWAHKLLHQDACPSNGYIPSPARVVSYNDIIPHLPPQWIGYHHIGTEVWIPSANGTNAIVCQPGVDSDPSCSASLTEKRNMSAHDVYFGIKIGLSDGCNVPGPH
ncbi:Alpha/Beta hydrolase protein [Syncephalis fuscata]|nr:Alpha/Beta hydrolase protein [Syncephalis fuscata]